MAPGFGVKLNSCGPNRIAVLSRLRQHLGLSLSHVKKVAAALPIILASGEDFTTAQAIAKAFELLGAEVEVYISGTGHENDPTFIS